MNRTLGAWVCLAAWALALSGCPSDKVEPEDGPPLAESGDAPDTGPLAPCSYTDAPAFRCGELENFDLSRCDRATLASAPTEGVYILKNRVVSNAPTGGTVFASAMKLSSDGTRGVIAGGPASSESRQGQVFYLHREWELSNGDISLTAYAGCQSSGAQPLTGCYVTCRNGQLRSHGTFEAIRATRREGEQEAEGLSLLSESFVQLGMPVDVYVTKGHAYVVSVNMHARSGGLTVFNVADPAKPVLVRTVTLPGDSYWNGVWSKGDALYVASNSRGVLVFDISDPASPVFVKAVPGSNMNVHTVLVEADRLYAMSPGPNTETLMFDIANPLEPVLSTRFTAPGGDTTGYPHDAFAYQERLYINHWNLGYLIVDARDPENFRQLGRYQYSNQTSHANAVGTIGGRTIAFEGGENYDAHLRVLDVTDPAKVVKLGEFRLRPQSSIHNMVLVGTRLYIAWYQEGVRVLDVSNPAEPRQLAYFNTFRETDFERGYSFYEGAIGMRVPGDGYVYVVDSSRGLLIFREP